ncbi:MAG: DUF4974 domain-containing protein [Niabella sp.]
MEAEEASQYLENNIDALDEIVFSEDLSESEIIEVPDSEKRRVLNGIIFKKTRIIELYIKKIAIAAAILILVFGGWRYIRYGKKDEVAQAIAVPDIHIQNSTHQDQRYLLPDGSEVVLKPDGEVVYKNDFKEVRSITLAAGDAYFKVFHDSKRPFVVLSNGIAIRALGTGFWVRNFKVINALSIALTEGKIMIYSSDSQFVMKPVYLNPGQTCAIDKTTGKVEVVNDTTVIHKPADKNSYQVPADGDLNNIIVSTQGMRFSNTTLANVFAKLEDRYHIKIVAEDPGIMNYNITGTIFYKDSLDVIIKSICELNNLRYEKRNDSLFLK